MDFFVVNFINHFGDICDDFPYLDKCKFIYVIPECGGYALF